MVIIIKIGGGILKNETKYWNVIHYIFGKAKDNKIIVVVSAIGRNNDPYSTDGLNKSIKGNLSIKERDRLSAIGETYATLKVTADLRKIRLRTKSFSYRELGLIIDKDKIKFKSKNLRKEIKNYDVLVVPGFIGRTKEDEPATLKREGSDYSAAIICKGLKKKEFFLVKDMPGIYDKDGIINSSLTYNKFIEITNRFSSPIGKDCIMFSKKHRLTITCINTSGEVVARIKK